LVGGVVSNEKNIKTFGYYTFGSFAVYLSSYHVDDYTSSRRSD
jgi:hypothetical protein